VTVVNSRQGIYCLAPAPHNHSVVASGRSFRFEEQAKRAVDFVDEAATHANGDIKIGLNVRGAYGPQGLHGREQRTVAYSR